MSSEKTEKATPKRREDARKEGRIARRPDAAAAFALVTAVLTLRAVGPSLAEQSVNLMKTALSHVADAEPLTGPAVQGMLVSALGTVAMLSAPIVVVALVAGVGGNFAQGGLTITPKAFEPKADRFNPVANLKRVFGKQSPVELIKGVLRLGALALACYGPLEEAVVSTPSMIGLPAGESLTLLGSIATGLGLRAAMVLAFMAALDYGYGWYQHEKSLRMSKQEIKDEYKQQEGDPYVKSQRRRAARSLTRQRIAVEVPKADVIVTNPTHFAVALRYDQAQDSAPVVLAKGADEMARKIREIAKANDIPIVENPPLARALFKAVEPGRAIAPEFFRAVAELLAFVYRDRERR